jgi:hypothetical protein
VRVVGGVLLDTTVYRYDRERKKRRKRATYAKRRYVPNV